MSSSSEDSNGLLSYVDSYSSAHIFLSLQRTYRSPLGLLLLHLGGLLLRSSLFALLDARVVELAALLEGRVVAHHEEVEQADDDTDRAHDDVQDAQAIRIGSGATEHHGHRAGG